MCNSKSHLLSYDVIRILAAFLVIFYHFSLLDFAFTPGTLYVPNFNRLIENLSVISVPLFFMVSGALMMKRSYSPREMILKTAKLLLIYFAWMLITYYVNCSILGYSGKLSLGSMIRGGEKPAAPVWYLRTLAILTLLSPFLRYLYDRHLKWLYSLVGLLLLFPFAYNYILIPAAFFGSSFMVTHQRTGLFTMYSVVYFILGKIMADHVHIQDKMNRKQASVSISLFVLGFVFTTAEGFFWTNYNQSMFDNVNSSFPTPGALLMAAPVFYWMIHIPNPAKNQITTIVQAVSGNLLGIYVFHMSYIYLYRRFLSSSHSLPGALGATFLVMTLSFLTSAFLKKIPVIRELLSPSIAEFSKRNSP